MKVKIFNGRMIENLEKEINDFIAGKHEIHLITQSESGDNDWAITICIWYHN